MISSTSTAAAEGQSSLSSKSLPALPSSSTSTASSENTALDYPSSILSVSAPIKGNIRRDPTLSDNPNSLPFASAAFAELHRRRVISAKAVMRPTSFAAPLPLTRIATDSMPHRPPPLPPKPEMLQFPDGSRVRASSISTPLAATTSLPDSNYEASAAASWLPLPPTVRDKRSANRVSVVTRNIKSRMFNRMTISAQPAKNFPSRRKSKITSRMANLMSSKRPEAGSSFFDSNFGNEADRLSDSDQGDDDDDDNHRTFSYNNGAAALAKEQDGDKAVIHHAERATFRRPIVVQCQAGSRKVAMQEALKTGSPVSKPNSWLDLDQRGISSGEVRQQEADEDADAESEGYDREAEERLERRLAEDLAGEQKLNHSNAAFVATDAEESWRDVVYDDSILDEHFQQRSEEDDDEARERERRGSAMSELDELVRKSLFIAYDGALKKQEKVEENVIAIERSLVDASRGAKRKVSFSRPPDMDITLARKKVSWLALGSPYPFGHGTKEEEGVDEGMYASNKIVEFAAELREMSGVGGLRSWAEGDKARKVLGLVEADEVIGLD